MQDYTEKFIADAMLGRLAVWLRILGYDVLYLKDIEDSRLVNIALKERRIILTRDTRMVLRKYIPEYVLIKSDNCIEQLKEVITGLKLIPDKKKIFTRCTLCNTILKSIEKQEAEGRVPEYTYGVHETFFECPHCSKIYWPGTHIDNVKKRVEELKN